MITVTIHVDGGDPCVRTATTLNDAEKIAADVLVNGHRQQLSGNDSAWYPVPRIVKVLIRETP